MNQTEKTPEFAPDGWKEYLTIENNCKDGIDLESRIFETTDKIWRKNSSLVFESENDDEKHHHELSRYSGIMKSEGVEPNDEKNLKDLGEKHLTDENHTYVKLWKEFRIAPGK